MQAKRHLAILAIAAALTGCATTTANLSHAPVAGYRDSIDLSGHLAVRYQKDGQPQNLNGAFTWTQRPGRVDVSLVSPLGQTLATISVTPQQATLTQAGQPPVVAEDIDRLTARTLGWSLPVSGLREWLQGHAIDTSGKPFTASPANNSVVTKDGWRLRFVAWQDESSAHPVPRRIDAERSATATSDELALRIVIDPAG
ncbi:MAG: outer membrane lipoprotein LolB [Telluria sp.]